MHQILEYLFLRTPLLLIFSELLGLEITKSNDVQIQQIIVTE